MVHIFLSLLTPTVATPHRRERVFLKEEGERGALMLKGVVRGGRGKGGRKDYTSRHNAKKELIKSAHNIIEITENGPNIT